MSSVHNPSRLKFSPLLILAITVAVDMTGFGMIIPLIPFYATSLGASPSSIGVMLASFAVMQVIFSPLLGRISDRIGRRPVLLISILTSIGSFILFTLANSFLILLLSRIVAGIATEGAVAQAYIADITTKDQRAGGMGKVGAAFGIGFIIGPAIGGLLSPYGFWAPGVAAIILSLVNFLFVLLFLPESSTTFSAKTQSLKERKGHIRTILDAVSLPITGSVYVIYFIVTLAFSAIPVIVPFLVVDFFEFTAVEMSYIFTYIGILQALFQGVAISKIAKMVSEEKLIIIGPLLMFLGIFLMPLIPNIILFLVTLSTMSSGVAITNTIVPSFISKRTSPDEQGGVLGLTQSVSSLARVPGPLLGGVIYDFGGTIAPFLASSLMLLIPVIIGCRVFQKCRLFR
jgi:multidrug resistance protein